jgi:glycosyltransferase involved in cell wall biosynthesis
MLYVGSVIGRKNLGGVIDAMRTIPKDLLLPIVIIGKGKSYEKEVRQKISAAGIDHLCNWINPAFADFPAIYSGAKLFVLPSFYEGFGIPLVEAMTVGTPILTSDQSALKEIGGDACLTVKPTDQEAIRDGIIKILTDTEFAKALSKKGKARAKMFHPDALTDQMMEIYKR